MQRLDTYAIAQIFTYPDAAENTTAQRQLACLLLKHQKNNS
jgi:hypothetical protein